MKLIKNLLVLSLASVMFIATACEDDDAVIPKPESATVSGTITYSGDWPSTGTVYLSVQNTWYPVDAPYATTTISESDVAANVYAYSFTEVAFGTYAAISVSWLDPEDTNPATNQHIIGVHGGTAAAYFADADSITVSEDIYELTSLDFGADFGLAHPAPESATISGTITFTGTYPDTGSVMLTLDTAYPPQGAPAGFKMIAETDLDNSSYVYSFSELAFGDFSALTVTYWPNGYSIASMDYTLLGSFPNPLIPPVSSFTLDENNAEIIIDIDADFGLVQP